MLIGFNLPISGPMATATDMARVAQLGEELGFDYLTLTDHIALPDVTVPGYPTRIRRILLPGSRPPHGATDRCRLDRRENQQESGWCWQ